MKVQLQAIITQLETEKCVLENNKRDLKEMNIKLETEKQTLENDNHDLKEKNIQLENDKRDLKEMSVQLQTINEKQTLQNKREQHEFEEIYSQFLNRINHLLEDEKQRLENQIMFKNHQLQTATSPSKPMPNTTNGAVAITLQPSLKIAEKMFVSFYQFILNCKEFRIDNSNGKKLIVAYAIHDKIQEYFPPNFDHSCCIPVVIQRVLTPPQDPYGNLTVVLLQENNEFKFLISADDLARKLNALGE